MSWAMAKANETLWRLLDNSVEDDEGYMLTCDECARLVSEDFYSEHDGLCGACHAACHFLCDGCGEEKPTDDRNEEYPQLCEGCGCEKHTELVDELTDELSEVIESWAGDDNEINKLRKLLAYARKLK